MQKENTRSSKLLPHDRIMRLIVLPFIPEAVQPNHVTALRFLLTPLVLWLLFVENYLYGVPLFIFTAFTDAIDGSLARVRNKITPWGIFFDPIADKLLIGSIAILLGLLYYHPIIIFSAIVLDILPSLRWASTRYVGTVMMANVWGKLKMFLQFTSFTCLLLGLALGLPELIIFGEGILAVSLVFALVAVMTYSL